MIPITGIHIEPTNICTLKCPGCARTRFLNQWPQHWRNHNLDIEDLLVFLDIDLSMIKVNFCGNYGDPIYHPMFLSMVEKVKSRGATISIITNGSYKKQDWWEKLCSLLTKKDTVTFSVDGLPTNFTDYRINADWDTIEKGMKVCVERDVRTVWKYIPFDFNQNDIGQAKSIAEDMGIDEFMLDPSDRYDALTQHLIPADDLIGSRKFAREKSVGQIDPKCFHGREHFITATGHYSPCCYVADHRFYYKTDFGKNKSQYDIRSATLSQILQQHQVKGFFGDITQNPPKVCQFNCPQV